jgi:hypothetical protein
MLYLRPKRDEETLGAINVRGEELEAAYRSYLKHTSEHQFFVIPAHILPKNIQEENLKLLRNYQQIRASIIGNRLMMIELAKRYNLPEPTEFILAATDLSRHSSKKPQVLTYAEQQAWFDALNTLLGAVRFRRIKEGRQLLNPFYWLWLPIKVLLQLPLGTLRVMGFNIEEFEKHFWGKFMMLVFITAILWIALRGFNISIEQLTKLIDAVKK